MIDSRPMTDTAATATRDIVDRWLTDSQPAVIFDFNGTLSDDEGILYEIYCELFAEHLDWRITAEEYRDEFLGLSDREIVETAVARRGAGSPRVDDLLALRRDRYQERVADHSPITDPAVALVQALADRHIPMAIVTGAQRDDVLAVLAHSPVGDHIAGLVTEEDVRRGKPDPEGFLSGARLLRRRPSDVLVFEDSVPGVRGALAARMKCIAVNSNPTPDLVSIAPAIVGALTADIVADALNRMP
jgi:beta-phosphoglucomutase